MADIRQAVEWLKDGEIVRREAWWVYEGPWDGIRRANTSCGLLGRTGLSFEDLAAEDWEIAE